MVGPENIDQRLPIAIGGTKRTKKENEKGERGKRGVRYLSHRFAGGNETGGLRAELAELGGPRVTTAAAQVAQECAAHECVQLRCWGT